LSISMAAIAKADEDEVDEEESDASGGDDGEGALGEGAEGDAEGLFGWKVKTMRCLRLDIVMPISLLKYADKAVLKKAAEALDFIAGASGFPELWNRRWLGVRQKGTL
jgi:hypothetical protein